MENNEEIQEAEVVQEDSPSKVIPMTTPVKQTFWDLLNEKHPEKIEPFNEWLAIYVNTPEWVNLHGRCGFGETVFADLPVVLQVGIWATFLNSRGEFGYDWKLTENPPTI